MTGNTKFSERRTADKKAYERHQSPDKPGPGVDNPAFAFSSKRIESFPNATYYYSTLLVESYSTTSYS
jgi:hypothetical protein